MLRPVVCSIFLLTLPTAAQSHRTEAQRLLPSAEAADRAWAAWHAGQDGDDTWVRPLLRSWNEHAAATGPGEDLARRAIADALIRIDKVLAAPALADIARRLPAAALVLIGRHREHYADLLVEMLEYDLDDAAMTAVRNHVAELRPRTLALHLLSGLQIELVVHASDSEGTTYGDAGPTTERSEATFAVPVGFPPITLDLLRERANPTTAPPDLAPYRVTCEPLTLKPGSSRNVGRLRRDDADARRLRYLAHLLRMSPDALGLQARVHETIVLADPARWPAAVEAARARITAALAGLRSRLLAAALLDSKTLQHTTARIAVRAEDHRADRSQPLPAVAAAAEVARIGTILWDTRFEAAMQRARRERKPLLVHFGENPG